MRLRQEWILGVGGVRVLRAVGIEPSAWHANEGHAAFMLVERLRELTTQGVPYADAVAEVRARSIFTTHTPVPAGHDRFDTDQVLACAGPVWEELGISAGRIPPDRRAAGGPAPALPHDRHRDPALGAESMGCPRKHGEVSRELWRTLWPQLPTEEVPIGHVTNGVHLPTWMAQPDAPAAGSPFRRWAGSSCATARVLGRECSRWMTSSCGSCTST